MNRIEQKTPNAVQGVYIDRLVALSKVKSHLMPSGLTREQRQQWAKATIKKVL